MWTQKRENKLGAENVNPLKSKLMYIIFKNSLCT